MKTIRIQMFTSSAVLLGIMFCGPVSAEDYWTPRGLPLTDAGRMKSINMIEPRTEITEIPFVIDHPGSYYVTAHLPGHQGSNGIVINCGDVKLDLNGFTMMGTADSGSAILLSAEADNIVIRNGVIRNWGQYGLDCRNSRDSSFVDLKAYGNGLSGLLVGPNSSMVGCSAYGNGFAKDSFPGEYSDGIMAFDFSTIVDCKARSNRGAGFNVYRAVRLTGCTAAENMGMGIYGWVYCTIRDCLITRNYSHGIAAYDNCRVENNNCGENGSVWSGNWELYGYGAGVAVYGAASRIEGNNVADNDYGIWIPGAGQGNLIIRNSASGNVLGDYQTSSAGDYMGYVYGTNTLNGGQTGFTADNPWSNFTF